MATIAERFTVRLRLQGHSDELDIIRLRQQLAACLCGGVTHVSVEVDGQADIDIDVLQALNGVAEYLHRRGGALTLVGAPPHLATKIGVHGLTRLSQCAHQQEESQ